MSNEINKIIYDSGVDSELTVALPVYNSKKIAWMAIESLCNQINVDFNWELIVYEEIHSESVFPNLIYDYLELLKLNKCCKIVFITGKEKVLLVDKWISIANNTSHTSNAFLLQAADCYSPKKRLKISYDKIVKENYDWYDQTKGYFYSFISNRIVLYNYRGLTNLNMCLKTDHIKKLPKSTIKKGIDGYIYNNCLKISKIMRREFKHYYDDNLYNDSIDTHGLNNISVNREEYFTTKPNIFKLTNLKLYDLGVEDKITNNLLNININKVNIINNNKYDLSIVISTYKNSQYLKECFNSIKESIGDYNVEVLVGVDSCLESYDFIVGNSFPPNFKFYFFEKNNGPYIVFNSLSKLIKSENIMFFGSDDIMNKNMVPDMINGLYKFDCVKPSYVDFNDGQEINIKSKKHMGEGVFGIKKSVFDYMNGFEPWMCAADSDFMGRIYKNKNRIKYTNSINFYHRIHKNGLTSRTDTGMGSPLRAHYVKLSMNKKVAGPLEIMVTEPFVTINGGPYIPQTKPNNIFIKKTENPINGLFEGRGVEIENQVKEINYDKINDIVGKRELKKVPDKVKTENKNSNLNSTKNLFIVNKIIKSQKNRPNRGDGSIMI